MADDKKVIFSKSGVSKTYPSANQPVIKNIYLSFFYGAKIWILGINGSGKSTVLKIIAGNALSNYPQNEDIVKFRCASWKSSATWFDKGDPLDHINFIKKKFINEG